MVVPASRDPDGIVLDAEPVLERRDSVPLVQAKDTVSWTAANGSKQNVAVENADTSSDEDADPEERVQSADMTRLVDWNDRDAPEQSTAIKQAAENKILEAESNQVVPWFDFSWVLASLDPTLPQTKPGEFVESEFAEPQKTAKRNKVHEEHRDAPEGKETDKVLETGRPESLIDLSDRPDNAAGPDEEAIEAKAVNDASCALPWIPWREPDPTSPLGDAPPKDDDASTVDGKLFGDLASLPSIKEQDMSMTGSVKRELNRLDDATASRAGNVASIVESKVRNIRMPAAEPKIADPTRKTKKRTDIIADDKMEEPAHGSLEARRQILVKELRTAISTFGRYEIRVANISAALGDLLAESKEFDGAIKLHKDVVSIYSTKLGDDHSNTLAAKMQLANVYSKSGQLDEAINLYFLVTAMRRALRGEKDPSAADSLVCMAHVLRLKGDYAQAIKELKRALKIYRESLGDAHEKVSATVDEIASLYVTLGDFEKSAAILEEVVKLKAATSGMTSAPVAATLCSLATTYDCSEQFTKAMKALKKAYKIYTELEGYSSEAATNTLNRIAQLYEAMGDGNRASIAYLGVLRGRKINYGDDHLKVAETYYKLGRTLRETGQQEKALKCMKEALPIFVGSGVETRDVEMIAEIMHEMALINTEKKHFTEAARILKQELAVRRKIGQAEFPLVARTLNHLGVAEFELKNNTRALKYLVEALTIFQQRGEQGVDCAEVLFNSGLVFESSRNVDRALEAFDEAARIFKKHGYKDTHPHLVKAYNKIERLQAKKNATKLY